MDAKPLTVSIEQARQAARDLLAAFESGDAAARERIGRLRPADTTRAPFTSADAESLIARDYGFESWADLERHAAEVTRNDSEVAVFEAAVDAVVSGDVDGLRTMLAARPSLVHARSTRRHRATLLHYTSANGVEDYRQRTPPNVVEVARLLLDAGAEVDAPSDGGTTLGLVATSYHPAHAGVQIALMGTLIDAGASPDGLPGGWNPLLAALANGRGDAAKYLAGRGARLDVEGAAGVGRVDFLRKLLSEGASAEKVNDGFAWACEFGRTDAVELLLQKGVAVDARLRHNDQTGLHWAAFNGHAGTVRLLLDWRAPVNAKDGSFDGTPLGWALYGWSDPAPEAQSDGFYDVVEMLVAAGGTADSVWLADPDRERPLVGMIHADARMRQALHGQVPPPDSMVG